MNLTDVEEWEKLHKCSHPYSEYLMGQLIHHSTDFKMSGWQTKSQVHRQTQRKQRSGQLAE